MANELPEGYIPLEYIQYSPQKRYYLGGYNTQEKANERIRELKKSCVSAFYDIVQRVKITETIEEFGILLPHEAISFLTEEEKKCILPEPSSPTPTFEEYNPIVYRFMDEEYVDEFLETGNIMLTTLRRCRKLEDKNRQDNSEGKSELVGQSGDLKCSIGSSLGDNILMFCTSLSLKNNKKNSSFYHCCLEINNAPSFAIDVTKQLLANRIKVQSVIKGPCVYSNRIIEKKLEGNALNRIMEMSSPDGQFDIGEFFRLQSQIGGRDMFFCKPISFSHEHEYRFIWVLENDFAQETCFVTCKEANKYCRKILL